MQFILVRHLNEVFSVNRSITWEGKELPLVFTAKEAGKFLRFSEATILRFVKEGVLQGVKVGGRWRFSREMIMGLVNQIGVSR